MGMFILFNFPSNLVLDKTGLWWGAIVGATFTAVGMCIKALVNYSFWWVYIGQILAAIGQPFICSAPAKLAAQWFGPNERIMALTIVCIC